jgi:hypothetical protein
LEFKNKKLLLPYLIQIPEKEEKTNNCGGIKDNSISKWFAVGISQLKIKPCGGTGYHP